MVQRPQGQELSILFIRTSNMSERIKRIYAKAGVKAPNGKGIHKEKFHRCVVKVTQDIRAGKLPKGSSAHAICMDTLGPKKAIRKSHRRGNPCPHEEGSPVAHAIRSRRGR